METEVRAGLEQYHKLLQQSIATNFQKFRAYVQRNIFAVPPDVDFGLDGPVNADAEKQLDTETAALLKKIAVASSQTEALRVHKYTLGEEVRKQEEQWASLSETLEKAKEAKKENMKMKRTLLEEVLKSIDSGGFCEGMDVDDEEDAQQVTTSATKAVKNISRTFQK